MSKKFSVAAATNIAAVGILSGESQAAHRSPICTAMVIQCLFSPLLTKAGPQRTQFGG